MRDLIDPRWMKLKAALFLVIGLVAATVVLLDCQSWRGALCLVLAIWAFCRLYYFAFYVIEHYIDPGYRFSGLGSFLRYTMRSRRSASQPHEE